MSGADPDATIIFAHPMPGSKLEFSAALGVRSIEWLGCFLVFATCDGILEVTRTNRTIRGTDETNTWTSNCARHAPDYSTKPHIH